MSRGPGGQVVRVGPLGLTLSLATVTYQGWLSWAFSGHWGQQPVDSGPWGGPDGDRSSPDGVPLPCRARQSSSRWPRPRWS